ncbi:MULTISPECIES: adenylyl-sulfate kinase [unclassified Nocardia]|uniref:adenylyl-sulfate kinase n=1 Tax=unclassified Nocardia TaxID=2637762 RepID=UPI001CE48870|nr:MULTISPECIES: adenylyl-sulfate kinase [unclassified Nocardia]
MRQPLSTATHPDRGVTLWLTGLPSAGKTTLAGAVASRLRAAGTRCEVLDGDVVRQHLAQDLGYSRADRDSNVRRVGWVARLLATHGVVAIASIISPYRAARDEVRAYHRAGGIGFIEVHVATPLSVCVQRDVKGLYARAEAGEITGLTGIDDPYEEPESPDIRLDTSVQTVEQSLTEILEALRGELPQPSGSTSV